MRPAVVVRRAAEYLERHDVESPIPTAEVLLANVLGVDRSSLYTRDEGLSSAEARAFGRALCRRCAGTPLQHLTREQAFRRIALEIRPGVFIPRPETEVVVEEALATISGIGTPSVVDVGTGTGAIALAIKDERPDAQVVAIDASEEAVALSRANAARLGLAIRIEQGDLLHPLPPSHVGCVDLVVSNPPYLPEDAVTSLPADVRADPPTALFGDIGVYDRLFSQARTVLRPGGAVVVEIEETSGEAVRQAAVSAGFERIRVMTDLAGRDRVLIGRSPG